MLLTMLDDISYTKNKYINFNQVSIETIQRKSIKSVKSFTFLRSEMNSTEKNVKINKSKPVLF